MEKVLPCNIEAECGVLGSIIIDPEAITRVADFLQPADFYRDAHRTLFEVMRSLYERREPADFITICDALGDRLEDVGGSSYITSLINDVPSSGNVEYYGRIVERTSTLRRLIYAAGQIAAVSYDGANAEQAIEKAESLIYAIGARRAREAASSLSEITRSYLADLDYLYQHRGAVIGIPTGFGDLDREMGGLQKTDFVILAARPKVGKTAFALNIARNAAAGGFRVGFFSLEMGKKQLMGRLMSMQTGIDSQYLRSGRIADYEWETLVQAGDALESLPIWIDDTGALSTTALRSRARRMQEEHGLDLLIVDYLQLLQARNEAGKRYENDVQETTEVSHALKALAKELDIPVLALSQLSRKVEERADKHPMLSDLRQSGSIEQDADIVLFLYRDELYHDDAPKGVVEVNIAAHRNGPVGDIELRFDAAHTRFSDEA